MTASSAGFTRTVYSDGANVRPSILTAERFISRTACLASFLKGSGAMELPPSNICCMRPSRMSKRLMSCILSRCFHVSVRLHAVHIEGARGAEHEHAYGHQYS